MKQKRIALTNFIIITVFFALFHSAIHNEFEYEHEHDSSCFVYVLEQYFVATDISQLLSIFLLFLPFLFITYHRNVYSFNLQKSFSSRAPPSL